jgi:DNA-binding NtrC family response regulator
MVAGYRMLVVEDESLIAQDIKEVLLEAEAIPVGPVFCVGEARQLIRDGEAVDVALLDVNFGDEPDAPVLEALHARGIPTLIYTGGSVPD